MTVCYATPRPVQRQMTRRLENNFLQLAKTVLSTGTGVNTIFAMRRGGWAGGTECRVIGDGRGKRRGNESTAETKTDRKRWTATGISKRSRRGVSMSVLR